MLASDLAKLFDIETKRINEAEKRNKDKFENGLCFQLNKSEYEDILLRLQKASLRSQPATSSLNNYGKIRYLPYVFTSEGIEVLSTILKSEKVREISKIILEVFKEKKTFEIIKKDTKIGTESIKSIIYEINGKPVILDEDLASLYQCKGGTKEINQAVKNNLKKFPLRYSWILSDKEFLNLKSKILTSSWYNYGGRRYNPRVFTEEGIYMLATILKTKIATEVSMAIIDTFSLMRKYISNNLLEQKYINNLVLEHDNSIKLLKESFKNFEEKKKLNEIYFNGEIFDAYSKIVEIMNEAKKELTVIDSYADITVLNMTKKIKCNITLIMNKRFKK